MQGSFESYGEVRGTLWESDVTNGVKNACKVIERNTYKVIDFCRDIVGNFVGK